MKTKLRRLGALTLLTLSASLTHGASADWVAVPAALLDAQRGGFTTPAGLQISLGVQRLVSINGTPVAQVSVQAVGAAAGASAQAMAVAGGARLIQQGGNNVFGAAPDLAGATFVQNSLNGQTIRTETHITANVNSAALMRDLNFYHSMREVALSSSGAR